MFSDWQNRLIKKHLNFHWSIWFRNYQLFAYTNNNNNNNNRYKDCRTKSDILDIRILLKFLESIRFLILAQIFSTIPTFNTKQFCHFFFFDKNRNLKYSENLSISICKLWSMAVHRIDSIRLKDKQWFCCDSIETRFEFDFVSNLNRI